MIKGLELIFGDLGQKGPQLRFVDWWPFAKQFWLVAIYKTIEEITSEYFMHGGVCVF